MNAIYIFTPLLNNVLLGPAQRFDRKIQQEMFDSRIAIKACRIFNHWVAPATYERRVIFKVIPHDFIICATKTLPFMLLTRPQSEWVRIYFCVNLILAILRDVYYENRRGNP